MAVAQYMTYKNQNSEPLKSATVNCQKNGFQLMQLFVLVFLERFLHFRVGISIGQLPL